MHGSIKLSSPSQTYVYISLFSSGNLMSIPIPSLYSTTHTIQNPSVAHMSATALLQKAAQLGSTTSNAGASSSLLKSFGKSADHPTSLDGHSFGGTTLFGGNNGNHLHDLVNSIAGGGSSASIFGGAYGTGNLHDQQQIDEYRGFHANNKLAFDHQQSSNPGGFSSLEQGRLTRDFLGVGEIVRSVREQQNGMDISSMGSQGKTTSQSQVFGAGNFQ